MEHGTWNSIFIIHKNQNVCPITKTFLIPELKHEVALTEKFLRRIPEDRMEWRAHDKSFTLRQLAIHLSDIVNWIPGTLEFDELEMNDYKVPQLESMEDIIGNLHKNAEAAEASLNKDDEEYHKDWTMKNNGQSMFTMQKYQVLRGMVLNQLPHHRAQLGVYLRLLDESVPATYGPSADERSVVYDRFGATGPKSMMFYHLLLK